MSHHRSRVVLDTGLASRRVEALVLLAVWFVFLILALRTFGPDSVYNNFHSDAAIPVLMANDDRPITVFDTYYYAADRWGGWPLLIAKAVHLNFGLHWTDQSLYYVRTVWLFLGLLALAALNARAAPAVLASALLVLCLEWTVRIITFDLSQLYGWQLTALFLAWFCLRRLLSVRVHWIFWSAAFYFSALFAIWSSVASVALLAVLVTLEVLRSHFLFQQTRRRIGLAVIPLFMATASEFLLKRYYHRYSLKHFGFEYKTGFALDFGYFSENLLTNWHNLVQYKLFPLIVVALCFAVGTVVWILYARGKGLLRNRAVAVFEDETMTMIIALTAMVAMNFFLLVSVNHVRTSFYNVRFHALTYLFGAISGLLSICVLIRIVANHFAVTRYVIPLVLAGAFIFLGINFPPRIQSERYKVERQTALALAEKAPRSILMGGYWETYVFVGLQPTNAMTPVPFEGAFNRTPWTYEIFRNSKQAVVEYRHSELVPKDSLPPNELTQHGNLLKLQDAHFYANGPYAFALYFNERPKP